MLHEVIRELRKSSTALKFFKLPGVCRWTDVTIVGLGDQAHSNRPRGGSTGGLLAFMNEPQIREGHPCSMVLVAWKSWKLKRVALGTNDAEVQSLVEAEDVQYKTRLLRAQMNGFKVEESRNLVGVSDLMVSAVPGLLGKDSKGDHPQRVASPRVFKHPHCASGVSIERSPTSLSA